MSMGLSTFVQAVVRPAASAAAVEAKCSGMHVIAVLAEDPLLLSPNQHA